MNVEINSGGCEKFSETFTTKTDWRNDLLSKPVIKENRVCHILKTQLYQMADNESRSEYKPLQLKWVFPIESTEGMTKAFKNVIFVLDYVQKNRCNKDTIDKIVENDIRPNISGVKDEYDFFIASTILIIVHSTDDFSYKDRLMHLVKDIIGDFITILEIFVKQFDFEEYKVEDIDVSKLSIDMVIKNYRELCKILGQEIKSGKSKKLQMEDFKRYFDFEKSGQKFIITDIYDAPLTKEDKRRLGNNSIYVKNIELILLQYLSKQKNGIKTFTKRDWWELLGMTNRKYNKIAKTELKKIDSIVTSFEINHFYLRCNKKLEQILFSALRNLKNRKLILEPEIQTVIVDNKYNYFLALDPDKKRILQEERYVLKNIMGYEKISQVFCRFKQNEYYKMVNERLNDLYGWHHYFKQIKLSFIPSNIIEAIPQTTIDLEKEILNEKIIKVLNNNAEEKYNTDKQKYEDARNNLLWGNYNSITKTKTWKIPDTYIEAQRILTEELINIGYENNRISLNLFKEDEELDQLFTSFLC